MAQQQFTPVIFDVGQVYVEIKLGDIYKDRRQVGVGKYLPVEVIDKGFYIVPRVEARLPHSAASASRPSWRYQR